jgi:hypothetical protein
MHKTAILHFVLYGCVTCSLTLRDEYELRVLQKKVLRKIFGSKREEETRGQRKLHEELLSLYCL